jgi:O-antigen/teichoic acid export membrane protein
VRHVTPARVFLQRVTSTRSLGAETSRVFVVNLLGLGITLAAHAWLARTLAIDGYGQFALALSVTTVLSALARLGWDSAAQRFVPKYLELADCTSLAGFLHAGRTRVLGAGVAMSIGLLVIACFDRLPNGMARCSMALAALVPLQAWLLWRASCVRASGHVVLAQTAIEVVRPLGLAGGCLLFIGCVARPMSAADTLAIYAAATLLSGVMLVYASRSHRPHAAVKSNFDELPEWQATARPLVVASMLELAYDQADVLLVGGLLGAPAAGSYALAARLAKLPIVVTTAITMTAVPRLAAAQAAGRLPEFRAIARRASVAMFAAASVAAGLVLFFAPFGLHWLGRGFAAAMGPLAVLLVGRCVASIFGPAMQALPLVGQARRVPIYLAIGLAIQMVAGAILIPFGGATAAAFIRSAAAVVSVQLARMTVKRSQAGSSI